MSVTIDIAVDAFVFNPEVCKGPDTRIAPITQPNYDFLSLTQEKVRADVLASHELQYTLPAEINSRLIDIGTGQIRKNRIGVYIHWILPTVYRTGEESAEEQLQKRRNAGNAGKQRSEGDAVAMPDFKPVPNRWLIVRRIKANSMVPADAPVPEVEGWIVESDRLRDVSELHEELDTQIDVSPFVSPEEQDKPPRNGRDFVGYKAPALGWTEVEATRANLTIMSSSNQLFPDYQLHNGNVFSICDNFSYEASDGETRYLEACDASYLVFGWHSSEHHDPLHLSPAKATLPNLLDLMRKHHVHLFDGDSEVIARTLRENEIWTLLQGAIHDVKWSVQLKPAVIPADEAAALFKDPQKVPIAVGAGPLDALFTYIQSHKELEGVEELILKIQTLLISQEDGVDEQNASEDLLRDTSFDGFEGGMIWHLSGRENNAEPGPGQVLPPESALAALRQANTIQAKLDALQRTLPTLQWEMFSHWWKFLCDRGKDQDLDTIKGQVQALSALIAKLLGEGSDSIYHDLPNLIQKVLEEQVVLPCEPAAAERFYQYEDPTLLIAGLVSGWPKDHINETKANLSANLKRDASALAAQGDSGSGSGGVEGTKSAGTLMDELIAVMPTDLKAATAEFVDAFLDDGDTQPVWAKQPWCPLFLEWEAEYYHIPFQYWHMDRFQSNSSSTLEHVRWGIESGTDVSTVPGVTENLRKISGRELLLPQPGFSLGSKVEQLFTNVPEAVLDQYVSKADREKLVSELANSFPYMSCTLSGFTNHLLTLQQGTHINPNQRLPGSDTVEPTQGAIELTRDKIGLGEAELQQVGIESETTPYATQVSGLSEKYAAFKPATHGQFRFTKIDIIDKFGQAISVIDQSPAHHPPPIYPCISELFSVQRLDNGKPNTVIKDPDGLCEFIQIPPRINQPVRLNAHFMVEDTSEGGWRPADDWENPIFGWLLINFANYGLQVFLPDGRFYREIRLGGASGASTSEPWLPFAPPDPPPEVNEELDTFLLALQKRSNMEGLYQMILDAFKHTQEAPDSYAQFLSALVGKPVALTNVGFSLELGTAEKEDQTVYPVGQNREKELSVLTYDLRLRIGDPKRVYDGLVGYFEPGNPEEIYTYFTSKADESQTMPIDATTYPPLKPFFIPPIGTEPNDYIKTRNNQLLRRVALLDPFVALHAYTGFSAVAEIKLPHWTVETALKQMTAFFHLGPISATKDVPEFNPDYKLTAGYGGDVKPYPGKGLTIPAGLKKEDWIWLQPYATGADQDVLEFMALDIEAAEQRVRWEPAPYTAVEGYLQLKRAIGGKPPAEDDEGQAGGSAVRTLSSEGIKAWTGVGTGWVR